MPGMYNNSYNTITALLT